MARRTIKPFTVEVRRSGRQKAVPILSAVQEQPDVVWPEEMFSQLREEPPPEPPAAQPLPPARTGRVLPALDEAPAAAPTPRRRRAKSTPEPEGVLDPVPMPDLDQAPEPVPAMPDHQVTKEVAPTLVRVRRLDRSEFARGERWKARLPTVVHRSKSRRSDR